MNNVSLIGRTTREMELKTAGENVFVSFNLAVTRTFKTNGEYQSDFINCKAFGRTAELLADMPKGSLVGISGRIQTGKYDNKDGTTVYTTDVMVNNITFCQSKNGAPAPTLDTLGINADDLPF